MTNEQQDKQRLRAWDDYQEARVELAAQRKRLEAWMACLANVHESLHRNAIAGIEQEFARLPTREEFAKGIEELKIARNRLAQTRDMAERFRWPVDKNDAD